MSHLLDGCRAKLLRTEETMGHLDHEIATFLNQDPPPYTIVREHQNSGLEYAFIAHGNQDPPLKIAVLAGEIIHHLRSSLDHLVHALVTQNGQIPNRQHQFPICTTSKAFRDSCDRGTINGMSDTAKKLVESVQPFTTPTPDDVVLWVISQYDNVDKHRLFIVINTVLALGDQINMGTDPEKAARPERRGKTPTIVGLGDSAPRKLSNEGVVVFTIRLGEPAPEFTAEAKFESELAFEKCGRVELVPVKNILGKLIAGTRYTVELFAGEF